MSELDRALPENREPAPEERAETIDVRQGMFGAEGTGDTSGYGRLVRPVQLPGATPRPYGGYFDDVADTLERAMGDGADAYDLAVERVVVDRGELTFHVRRESLVGVLQSLRDDP
ncbi:MAG: NADH-quinone oxidoreductase subunit, partial [Actinomycetota bacterium]|nr:NADH-quinone oxidoreductase subunit [Actinomycetota bacterium]